MSNNLPNEYLELEWIGSTGTQWIDTDVFCSADDTVTIVGKYDAFPNTYGFILGCHSSGVYRRIGIGKVNGSYKFIAPTGYWNEANDGASAAGCIHSIGYPFTNGDLLEHTFTYKYVRNSMTIDGTEYPLFNGFNDTSANRNYPGKIEWRDNSMVILGYRHDSTYDISGFAVFQLKKCIITQGENTVRDMVPALRKLDNKPGMYDLVNDVFYVNGAQTGKDFYYHLPNYKTYLHDKYEELNWLQSTQPINVGSFSSNITIVLDGMLHPQEDPPGSYDGIMDAVGTANYGGSSTSAQMVSIGANHANYTVLRINGSWPYCNTFAYERHIFTLDHTNSSNILYVDSTQALSVSNSFNTDGKPIYFFGKYRPSGATVYSGKIYDNGTLVRDLIPVHDRVDNKFGLYDILNDKFYTSDTGTCTAYEIKEVTIDTDRFLYKIYSGSVDSQVNNYKSVVYKGEQ